MTQQCISIKIEGDFIDSFIYSGTLFLVHANSKITTHDWETLLVNVIAMNRDDAIASTYEFLRDCRCGSRPMDRSPRTIFIYRKQLEDVKISTLQLSGWSTDINVYANRLYIASENGVEKFNFDFQSKRLDLKSKLKVWHEYAYKVSPNDSNRLAIAAGQNGVVAIYHRNGDLNIEEDMTTLLEIDSHDCEWVSGSLVANSIEGVFMSTFPDVPNIPKHGEFPAGFWKYYQSMRRSLPASRKLTHDGDNFVNYAWLAGSRLFSLYSNGTLSVERINSDYHLHYPDNMQSEVNVEIGMSERIAHNPKVLAARSGLFGSIIEVGDELCSVMESGTETITTRPVSWRVFPRAKSYLNHLHIVENDFLVINAYFSSTNAIESDRFGISIEDVL